MKLIWKTDPSEIENLQYKKTADSVILSLFVRTNGKCNNSHAQASLAKMSSSYNVSSSDVCESSR